MIKQYLVNNSLARVLFSLRDQYELLRMAFTKPEELGTVANDQFATHLSPLFANLMSRLLMLARI